MLVREKTILSHKNYILFGNFLSKTLSDIELTHNIIDSITMYIDNRYSDKC